MFRCFQCRSDQQPDCGDERFNPYRCMWWWKCVTIYFPSALSTRSVTISSLRAPLLASKQSNMVRDFRNNRHITSFNDVLPAAGHTIVIRGCAPFTSEVTSNHHFFISDLISMCLARKKWSNSHSQAFSPEMARSIGGNYWKVVKTKAFEQNLFLKNLPPQKSNVISFCTYNQCNGGTQPNLTFSAVFISTLLALAGSHLWQKRICWTIHIL